IFASLVFRWGYQGLFLRYSRAPIVDDLSANDPIKPSAQRTVASKHSTLQLTDCRHEDLLPHIWAVLVRNPGASGPTLESRSVLALKLSRGFLLAIGDPFD